MVSEAVCRYGGHETAFSLPAQASIPAVGTGLHLVFNEVMVHLVGTPNLFSCFLFSLPPQLPLCQGSNPHNPQPSASCFCHSDLVQLPIHTVVSQLPEGQLIHVPLTGPCSRHNPHIALLLTMLCDPALPMSLASSLWG